MKAMTEVEMPLVHVLQRMEAVGIAVDINIFEKHRVRFWTLDATAFKYCHRRIWCHTQGDLHCLSKWAHRT